MTLAFLPQLYAGFCRQPSQFLRLYNALVPVAQDSSSSLNIEQLWGGNWENPETQLSFICAFASLMPDQLDASTIPGLSPTLTLESFAQSPSEPLLLLSSMLHFIPFMPHKPSRLNAYFKRSLYPI
ncbi:hypothetical protein HYQ46_005086 [Verticillium longisporum]|nr:hypothetical protein HYQ46_005086 [Verticillium longisporum]